MILLLARQFSGPDARRVYKLCQSSVQGKGYKERSLWGQTVLTSLAAGRLSHARGIPAWKAVFIALSKLYERCMGIHVVTAH